MNRAIPAEAAEPFLPTTVRISSRDPVFSKLCNRDAEEQLQCLPGYPSTLALRCCKIFKSVTFLR